MKPLAVAALALVLLALSAACKAQEVPATATPSPVPPGALPSAKAGLKQFLLGSFADTTHGWIAVRNAILVTEDGGQHWVPRSELGATSLDFISPELGWAAVEEGLLMTEDGGQTWQKTGFNGPGWLNRIDFVDARHGWTWNIVIGAKRDNFLRTTDGGSTWTKVPDPCPHPLGKLPLGPFTFIDANKGWIMCSGMADLGVPSRQLLQTRDGGKHWERVADVTSKSAPNGLQDVSDLFFLDASYGWFVDSAGLFATNDGGLTWRAAAWFPAAQLPATVTALGFLSAEEGYVVYGLDGAYALLKTADGGATWTQAYPPPVPAGLRPCGAADLQATLGGYNGAMQSSVGGVTVINRSSTTCALQGQPQVLAIDSEGKVLDQSAPAEDGAGEPMALAPGQAASSMLGWPNSCQPQPMTEGVTLAVVLPRQGGRVLAPPDPAAAYILVCTAPGPPSDPWAAPFEPMDPPLAPP